MFLEIKFDFCEMSCNMEIVMGKEKVKFPWGTTVALLAVFGLLLAGYALWTPFKVRYFLWKYHSESVGEKLAGIEGLLGMGRPGMDALGRVLGSRDAAELLAENWADVDAEDRDGPKPLQIAAKNGWKAVVEILIAKGADVHRAYAALSPLRLAALYGYGEIVKLLLENGANKNELSGEFKQFGAEKTLALSWLVTVPRYPGQVTNDTLRLIGDSPHLETLDMAGCDYVSEDGLAYLKGLKNLKTLYMSSDIKITDNGARHLRALKNLESLGLTALSIMEAPEITDTGIKYICSLKKLKHLDLGECSLITDKSLEYISALKELESLGLHCCEKITDNGLYHIFSLTKLRLLDLAGCTEITDKGVAHLKNPTNLNWLNLGGTRISWINPNFKSPEIISFGTKITDKGLEHIKELKNLRELHIENCEGVTKEGVEKLKAALPSCKIMY
jgi:predicted transcriptional regulator